MLELIQEFLSCERIAVVGVSHQPKDFSRILFRAFRDREYDVVPVNPGAREVEGEVCFPKLQDVEPPVEAALLMTSPAVSGQVVKDCVAAGVRRIWLYRRSGEAEAFCAAQGVPIIAGECPMMFLPNVGWIHRFHRWIRRV
jgi:predicted CoA-binding protein